MPKEDEQRMGAMLGRMIEEIDGIQMPTDPYTNVQLLDELELSTRFHAVTQELLARGEALDPTTDTGRDLHSTRSAYLVEMKRRGMR